MAYEQSAYTRTMPNQSGFVAPTSGRSGYNRTNNKKKNTFQIPAGMFGRRGSGVEHGEQEWKDQIDLDKMVWKRSTPDVIGVGGGVRWDRDKNMMTSYLSDDNQAIYDDMFRRQGVFGGQVDELAGGGWRDARDELYQDTLRSFEFEDAKAESARLERQQNQNTGDYANKIENLVAAQATGQRNLGAYNNSFLLSQGLIDSNLSRQQGDINMMSNLGSIPNALINQPVPQPLANMENVSNSITNVANLRAARDQMKSASKGNFWNSLLSGGSSLFSV
jgi:hypothetical protein